MEENGRKSMKVCAILAFVFDLACVPVFLLGNVAMYWDFGLFSALFWLIGVLMPIAAVLMGIFAICLGRRTKTEIIFSAFAIAIPIVAILVTVLLFATGVWVIRFM